MRGHFSKADIVVIQDPVLAGFVLFSFKGLNNKPKLVVESHGDFIETITLEKTLLFPWFYKFILKKIASYSLKHKINSRSSTEAELVGVDDMIGQVLWTNELLRHQNYQVQGTVIYQDNQSAILLEKNAHWSKGKLLNHNICIFFHVFLSALQHFCF